MEHTIDTAGIWRPNDRRSAFSRALAARRGVPGGRPGGRRRGDAGGGEETEALLRVATAAASGEPAAEVLAMAVAEARRLLRARAVVVVCNESGPRGIAHRLGAGGIVLGALGADGMRGRTVSAPITQGDARWGRLVALDPQADSAALVRLAELVGFAVTRDAERRSLERAAGTDALTGLANRRAFQARIDTEVALARGGGRRLAIASIDLDHFKRLNDEFGHQMGDEALRLIGAALAARARARDLVARVGGEEIAWLMPGTSLAEALAVAERACEAIRAVPLGAVSVTASVGVAELADGEEPADLIRRADAALYRAKRLGRDRIEQAS